MQTLTLPEMKETLTASDYADACSMLGISPIRTLRDPVSVLPLVASCKIVQGQRFLSMVLRGRGVDLDAFETEDAARLIVSAVFVHFIARLRRQVRRVQDAGHYPELCTG